MGPGLTLKTILRSLFDKGTPTKQKLAALLASLYTISPIDLILDSIAVIGILDDGAVLTGTLVALRFLIPEDVYKKYEEQYEEDPGWGMGKILLVVGILWFLGLLAIWFAIFN